LGGTDPRAAESEAEAAFGKTVAVAQIGKRYQV